MAYNLKDNRGMIADPISFRDATGLNAENIAACMREQAEMQGVPVNIRTDIVKEGGLFGKTYPCVIIHHPNPPQQYFTDVYIINNNTVNFYFFGNSKANHATNLANARKNTFTGMLLNGLSGSKEMELQAEMNWHRQVLDLFESLLA